MCTEMNSIRVAAHVEDKLLQRTKIFLPNIFPKNNYTEKGNADIEKELVSLQY